MGTYFLVPAEGWWPSATWIAVKKKLDPHFFIGGPLLYQPPPPPAAASSYPLHRVFFLPPFFFIGGPPLYPPPPPPPPLPLAQSILILIFFFGGHLGFYWCKKHDGGKGREGKEGTRLGFLCGFTKNSLYSQTLH